MSGMGIKTRGESVFPCLSSRSSASVSFTPSNKYCSSSKSSLENHKCGQTLTSNQNEIFLHHITQNNVNYFHIISEDVSYNVQSCKYRSSSSFFCSLFFKYSRLETFLDQIICESYSINNIISVYFQQDLVLH